MKVRIRIGIVLSALFGSVSQRVYLGTLTLKAKVIYTLWYTPFFRYSPEKPFFRNWVEANGASRSAYPSTNDESQPPKEPKHL